MKIWLMFFLLLSAAALLGFQYFVYPQLQGPKRLEQALTSVQQELLVPDLQSLRVTAATIVAETDSDITLSFDFSGRPQNFGVSVCGDIKDNGQPGPWGCQPQRLTQADGRVSIRFTLASTSRAIECSDQVAVLFYSDDGSVFYRHWFTLPKVWHQSPGLWSWYQLKRDGCPARQP